MIAAIDTDDFASKLSNAFKRIAPFDYTVVFGYLGSARPLDLYDDFPSGKRRVFVEDYQEGPYLLDPFYLASTTPVESGLYRLRDLAPDRFYQGEYFRNYYVQTGLAEEIGFFINLPGGVVVVVSLMRAEKAFTAKEIRELRAYWPVVEAACCKHWRDLATQFGAEAGTTTENGLYKSLELAFQTFGKGVLTPREREVVEFTLKGHSAEAVGRILEIAPGTVRIHRRNIYSKLQIRSQGELFSEFIDTLLQSPA
nr:helix-turn-helix transcriptional regulator [Thalassovita mangrovi]